MIGASIVPDIDALVRAQQEFTRIAEQMLLDESDRAAMEALAEIRTEMGRAGLGRLGNGIGFTSDKRKGRGVYRRGGSVSASGIVFIRSKSERTRGTIESYTEGSIIRPRKGKWLWIASDDLPAKAGGRKGEKMTPALYNKYGYAATIGPLVPVMSSKGTPLLIIRNVGLNAAGKSRSAKSLTKKGLARKGQIAQAFIVAFFAIKETSRQARLNPKAIAAEKAMRMSARLRMFGRR